MTYFDTMPHYGRDQVHSALFRVVHWFDSLTKTHPAVPHVQRILLGKDGIIPISRPITTESREMISEQRGSGCE